MNRTALLLLIAAPLSAANVHMAPRRSACGISFRVPRGWIVETYRDADDIPCAVGLKPPGWNEDPDDDADVGDYAITLQVTKDNFDEAAERAGFRQVKTFRSEVEGQKEPWPPLRFRDDDWVAMDRFSHVIRALPIESAAWNGLMADVLTGLSRRHPDGGSGGNAGIGNIVVASIVSHTRPSAAVVLRGGPRQDDAVRAVVRTIQFRRRR